MKKKWLTLIAGAALVLSLSACGGNEEDSSSSGSTSSDSSQTASSSEGDTLYQQSCASCHGGELQGMVGPSLTKVGGKYSEEEIEKIIINGRGGMPAGVVPEEDAKTIAAWLAEKK